MVIKENVKYVSILIFVSVLLIFITFKKYSPKNNFIKIKVQFEECLIDTVVIVDKNSTRLCTKEHILNSVDYCFKNVEKEFGK